MSVDFMDEAAWQKEREPGTIKIPSDAALDAVQIIMFLMKDHPHQLVISGEAIEEMRDVYKKVLDVNGGVWPFLPNPPE